MHYLSAMQSINKHTNGWTLPNALSPCLVVDKYSEDGQKIFNQLNLKTSFMTFSNQYLLQILTIKIIKRSNIAIKRVMRHQILSVFYGTLRTVSRQTRSHTSYKGVTKATYNLLTIFKSAYKLWVMTFHPGKYFIYHIKLNSNKCSPGMTIGGRNFKCSRKVDLWQMMNENSS